MKTKIAYSNKTKVSQHLISNTIVYAVVLGNISYNWFFPPRAWAQSVSCVQETYVEDEEYWRIWFIFSLGEKEMIY